MEIDLPFVVSLAAAWRMDWQEPETYGRMVTTLVLVGNEGCVWGGNRFKIT